MKTNLNFQSGVRLAPIHQLLPSLLLLCFMLSYNINLHAQSYSKFYYQYGNYEFNKPATYITQKFYRSVNNPNFQFEGTIMVQRVVDVNTGKAPIQITLVDDMGNFIRSFFVFTDDVGEFVPTCAAYNSNTHRYCIAGINRETGITGSPIGSWFIILSEACAYIDAQKMSVAIPGNSGENNFFVTDITAPVVDQHSEFVFVGVAGNTSDPSPVAGSSATIQKTIFMGGLDYYSSTLAFGLKRLFDYSTPTDWDTNNQFFPSRIIELPFANSNGGFLITGSAVNGSIFFTRTHYNFTDNGFTKLYKYSDPLFAGDLYYDPAQSEVWFAGIQKSSESIYFIYQKVINLTSSGVGLYADALSSCVPTSDYFFRYKHVFDSSPLKVSKIMPTGVSDEAAIAANSYHSQEYYSTQTHTYPSLHRINYSDAALSGFCINSGFQYPDLYTYPRFVGNDGFDNYFSYLKYDKIFYPSHTAHELPYNIFNDETYVMGSSTYDLFTSNPPEKIVLTRTSNFYFNDCYQENLSLAPSSIQTTQTDVDPIEIDPEIVGPYELNYDTDFTIDVNDCINDNVFKQNTHLTTYDFNYLYHIDIIGDNLTIQTKIMNSSYKLYNCIGELLIQGKINSGYAFKSIANFPSGIYLVEILSDQYKRVGVKKININ